MSKLLQFQKCLFLYLALLIPVPLEGVVVDGVAIGVEEHLAMLGAVWRNMVTVIAFQFLVQGY